MRTKVKRLKKGKRSSSRRQMLKRGECAYSPAMQERLARELRAKIVRDKRLADLPHLTPKEEALLSGPVPSSKRLSVAASVAVIAAMAGRAIK